MTRLTSKQHAVFDCIRRYLAQHHRAPLIREIQAECGIASYKSTVDRLNALEHKGYIKRRPNKHRGILLQKLSQPASPEPLVTASVQTPADQLNPVASA